MATTITSAFQKLKENLEVTGLQKTVVSTRQEKVRDAVSGSMDVLDSFLTGSYSRATMIAPLKEADIDIFIILDPKYYETDGQAGLLDKVKNVLLKTYPTTPKISRNGQAVTITFTDFVVDVVPAFNRKGGGYLIPNSARKVWLETNPKIHVELMTSENTAHDGDLVPLVKMIKGWNKHIGDEFVSFYLELLTIKLLDNVKISNFSSGCRYFFDKGREGIKYKVADPAKYGDQINGLRNCKTVEDAIKRFETAYSRSIKAENFAKQGDIEKAISEWKLVFGDYFPAYG
ncbi:MAG TPA: CBASS oligonucleotide cyclase [Anaerolineales bacterium]|nr:CBASS oligonucleotide cyclase [Anaerolineales bacterium]